MKFSLQRIIKTLFLFVILFAFSENCQLNAQFQLSNWKTYTSLFDTRVASMDSKGRIWVGTSGGVYNLDITTNVFREFRNINALLSIDITSLYCNKENKTVYIGAIDGYLGIVTEDYTWTHNLDIVNANFTNPKINCIIGRDSLLYIGGGFGLAVFNTKNNVFPETILRIGNFPLNTEVNKLFIQNNTLWVATEAGVASIDLTLGNFSSDLWKNYTEADGLPDLKVNDIAVNQDTLYVSTDKTISKFQNNLFSIVFQVTAPWDIIFNISGNGPNLYFSKLFDLDILYGGIIDIKHPANITGHTILSDNSGPLLVIFYKDGGIGTYRNSQFNRITPKSPISNQFINLDFDNKGNLWACSDGEHLGLGFMRMKNGIWENFTQENLPDIPSINSFYRIKSHPNGKVYVGSWGAGFLLGEETQDGYKFVRYDSSNSPIGGGYMLMGGSAYDYNNDKIWFLRYWKTSPEPLLFSYDKNGIFDSKANLYNATQTGYRNIAVDNYSTKWLGSVDNQGLYYFNDNVKPAVYGNINTSNSKLLDNNQNSIVSDKSGLLWIGRDEGASYIINPSFVINNSNPMIHADVQAVKGQKVNDIMVDALNYKWIATNNGIFVLNEDGSNTLAIITQDNSPLISNEVLALTTDEVTGKVFIGTKHGLNEVSTLSVKAYETFDISCYPQPFTPMKDKQLVIDGLAPFTDFRIVTIDGTYVIKISSIGRTAVWDGKDQFGKYVESGIYLILADSPTNNTKSVAKFAVIRR